MKIDHIVVNVDERYQTDRTLIDTIRNAGFLYEPKYGKGTAGFKASNIWIGEEYFEFIRITRRDGGGWRSDWTERYHRGHRGTICIFFEVDDIDQTVRRARTENIAVSDPEWLRYKWLFGLLTRTMPWRNAYVSYFERLPLQFGYQQYKDGKTRELMLQYMYPNSRDHGIDGIQTIEIHGEYGAADVECMRALFPDVDVGVQEVRVRVNDTQSLVLVRSAEHFVHVRCRATRLERAGTRIEIENLRITIPEVAM